MSGTVVKALMHLLGRQSREPLTCPYAQSTMRGCGLAPLVSELGPMVTAGGEFIRAWLEGDEGHGKGSEIKSRDCEPSPRALGCPEGQLGLSLAGSGEVPVSPSSSFTVTL